MPELITTIGLYIVILAVKIFEVTLATTRIVLITKGEKIKGAFIGFFEVIIWILLVSTVLDDIASDPIKIFVYALGFAIGNYVGTTFEEKLGVGTVRVEVIVREDHGEELAQALRQEGFAVTVLEGEGMNYKRNVLIMHIKRKRTKEAISLIKGLQDNVVITINEIKPIYGGYGVIKK